MAALRARGSASSKTCSQEPETAQSFGPLPGETRLRRLFLKLMLIFLPDAGQKPGTGGLRRAYGIQKTGHKSHVARLQGEGPPGQGQALQGQRNRLGRDAVIHRADTLQTDLADFLEGVAFLAGAVYIFRVIVATAALRLHLGVFGDGEGDIRLEGQQAAVQICKGDDLLTRQETAVFLVEAVLLKAAHMVLPEPRAFIQHPQLQR